MVKIARICAVLCVWAAASWCQESRGVISGRVADPQGAVIPGAAVVITNVETNAASPSTTNQSGYFEVGFLTPGRYSIAVEAAGFRKTVRTGLILSVAGRLDIEFSLQVGQVTETIEVTAAAPLLDTMTASGGRVVDNRQIMQLPFGDMNPFALTTMAPGMQFTGRPEERRAFDLGTTSSFNTMGGVGQNEYSIDGAPVTGTNRRVGFVPPSDAIEEFKVETTPFDASYGHTSGSVVNVMTKAGTNTYHGSVYDQHWQQRWNASRHFTGLAFQEAVRRGDKKPGDPKEPAGRSNNFGGALGGPVFFPKLFNGKDKLFFFFSYSGFYQRRVETESDINRTVPKMAWRQGDFSDLLGVDAVKYTVYDPRSARQEGSRVVRTPFPGNKGVPVLNPLYNFYARLYPRPNDVPGLVSPEGKNNYLNVNAPKNWDYNSLVNRYDYNIAERHRLLGRWFWNHGLETASDWTNETMPGLHNSGLLRVNAGAGGSYVWTIGSSDILELGANWARSDQGRRRPAQTQFKPTDVGLPAYLDARAGDYHILPQLVIGGVETVSAAYPVIETRGHTGELRLSLTSVRRNHSLKYGWQERRYWFASAGPGFTSGSFTFNQLYTRAADNTTTASDLGLGWAAFMMGAPSGAVIDTNDTGYFSTRYRSLYVQDDIRISNRLRVNLGLRYEREGGITERFNRGISGGFLFDAKLPFTDLAQAAYARNPLAELPASQFKVLGGTEYLDPKHSTFTAGTHLLLPRAGVVYQLNDKTVLRAGYGWYYDTLNANNTRPNQRGYSQTTSTSVSNDNGLTFCCSVGAAAGLSAGRNPLLDPFPVRAGGTRFDEPYGNTLGLMALTGTNYTFTPRDYVPAWQQRWRIGLQRELMRNMAIEVSYNGSYSLVPITQTISFLPEQYWASGSTRNQALDNELNRTVPNPFNIGNLASLQNSDPAVYNYLRTQSFFTSTTVRKNQLLRAFPQMSGLSGLRPGASFDSSRGGVRYHDVQVQLERRFTLGFQTAILYTYVRSEAQDVFLNEFDASPSWRTNRNTRPHRFIWNAIYQLPFGKGRRWVTGGPLQHVVGGWQMSWIYQYQSGPATSWGNRFFYGDIDKIADVFKHDAVNSRDVHMWFDPNIRYTGTGSVPQGFQGFEGRSGSQPGQFHRRVFPTLLTDLRADGLRGWDAKIQRVFRITEKLNTSFSVDLLNATNHTNFDVPNTDPTNRDFGRVTTQVGTSRTYQFNLRIDF